MIIKLALYFFALFSAYISGSVIANARAESFNDYLQRDLEAKGSSFSGSYSALIQLLERSPENDVWMDNFQIYTTELKLKFDQEPDAENVNAIFRNLRKLKKLSIRSKLSLLPNILSLFQEAPLEELQIIGNGESFTNDQLINLIASFSLSHLGLINMGMNLESVETVFSIIDQMHLIKLDLSHNYIEKFDANLAPKFSMFLENCMLESLNLSHNFLNESHICCILEIMSNRSLIKELGLRFITFREIKKSPLANVLSQLSSLEYLDVANNKIHAKSFCGLMENLQTLKNLKKLDVAGNFLDDTGFQALKNVLLTVQTVEVLLISDNITWESSLNEIYAIVMTCKSLKELHYKRGSPLDIDKLIEAISSNSSLKVLDISGLVKYSVQDIARLIKAAKNLCLLVVDVLDWKQQGEPEKLIIEALSVNTNVHLKIRAEGIEELASFASRITALAKNN